MSGNNIKKIYFNCEYKIKGIKCKDNIVYLSDFKYKSLDGNEYMMVIRNKGYSGSWHVIKLLSEDKLYVTDNLWYSEKNEDFNAEIVEREIYYSDLIEKYNDKNINYINSLDYINECDIDNIKTLCEETIKKCLIEEERTKFKYDNLTRHICSSDDSDMGTLKILSYPRNMDINNIVYEVCSDSHSEFFGNIREAQTEYLKWLSSTVDNKYNQDMMYGSKPTCKTLYLYLISVEQKYLNRSLLEEAYKYDIFFTKSKKLNKLYNDDNVYIMKSEWIKKYKTLCKCDFIDYNLLNLECENSKCEKICNEIMKELFPNEMFENIQQDVMSVSNKEIISSLQLNIYSENLKIAVEYNGPEHYEFIHWYHKNEKDFIKKKNKDISKNKLCIENGIKLINVHYSLDNY